MQVRVVLADDNPIVRAGLASLLDLDDEVELCGEAADGEVVIELVEEHHPDVVLLDVRMPGTDGLSVIPSIVSKTKILMLTHSDEPAVVSAALSSGATGYLVHGSFGSDELLTAIKDTASGRMRLSPPAAAVLAGGLATQVPTAEPASDAPAVAVGRPDGGEDRTERWTFLGLSPREIEICEHLVRGADNRDIAASLFIEHKTVKNHLNRIFAKLAVTSRAQAIAVCLDTAVETGPRDPKNSWDRG